MASIFKKFKKSIEYLRKIDNAIRFIQEVFHSYGLWPTFQGPSIFPRLPFIQTWCPRFVLAVSAYFTLISSPMAAYLKLDNNLAEMMDPLGFAFMTSFFFIYVGSLHYRGKLFEQVFRTLNDMRTCAAQYSKHPKVIKDRAQLYNDFALAYILQFVVLCLVSVLICFPTLLISRKFLFGSWFPYDAKASPYFEITTVVWFVYMFFGAGTLSILNYLLLLLFSQAITDMRLLRYSLEKVNKLSVKAVKMSLARYGHNSEGESSLRRNWFMEQELDREMKRTIALCARHHKIINRFLGDVSSAFGPILIHQLNCCLIPTAMSVVMIVYEPEITVKTVLHLMSAVTAFFNLFMFCWMADKINMESSLVGFSAYSCDWVDASSAFKRSVLMIMTRSNQPIEVIVAGFIRLKVSLAYEMIKMTYTHYMSALEARNLMLKEAAAAGIGTALPGINTVSIT